MNKALFDSLQETRSSGDASLHRVVIVGGGAAGLKLASRLGNRFGKRRKASITLIDRTRIHVWKPLLHEVAAGSVSTEVDSVEFLAHARAHHYRYRIGEVVGLDRARRQVHVAPSLDEEGRQIIPPRVLGYDTLVMAVGSISNDFGTPGAAEHAIALDSADQAARFNRVMVNACLRANAQYEPLRPGQLHCAIIGAGATGVELAAELHKSMRDLASYGLDNIDFDKLIRLTVVEAAPRILPALPEHLAVSTAKLLGKLGVEIRCGTKVVEVSAEGLRLADGTFLPAELVVWSAGIKAPEFLKDFDGLETDRINRLVVRDTLQTTRDENIFAIGDCACCILPGSEAPLPPRAQTAQQQAGHLVATITARLGGRPVAPFRYRDFGSLVSLSEYRTFGSIIGGLKAEGFVAEMMHRALYQMHLGSVHGTTKAALDALAGFITRRTEPRIKLH